MVTPPPREWPAQWLRGALTLCTLRVIADHGPLHGYAITQRLQEAGLGSIGGGTLYPLLGRFERDELVTADWVAGRSGPAKKVYTLTDRGAWQLAEDGARWAQFTEITARVVSGSHTKDRA